MTRLLSLLALITATLLPAAAIAQTAALPGVVVLHGKGGRPEGLTAPLDAALQRRGWPVISLDMPWSGSRKYNAGIAAAESQVSEAISSLRKRGATKIFLAGHSQGAVFALYYASRNPLDGLILVAPGGNVATAFYQQQIGSSVSRARQLVVAGKGEETGEFDEFEGGKGHWKVQTTAASYLSWFNPDGAMNQLKSSAALPKTLPVLHVAPTSDYPSLLRSKQEMFDAIASPLKTLHEPASDHRNVPRDAAGEIGRWIGETAGK